MNLEKQAEGRVMAWLHPRRDIVRIVTPNTIKKYLYGWVIGMDKERIGISSLFTVALFFFFGRLVKSIFCLFAPAAVADY